MSAGVNSPHCNRQYSLVPESSLRVRYLGFYPDPATVHSADLVSWAAYLTSLYLSVSGRELVGNC